MSCQLRFRPLSKWGQPDTAVQASPFVASWDSTLDLLRREVEMLSDKPWPLCVIEVDVPESSIRQDGNMAARAVVHSQRVAASFDSRYGPLRYECGTFDGTYNYPGWRSNVRAIALGLEALRKVVRYGIAHRGEQYTGWAALGPGAPIAMGRGMTVDEAAQVIVDCSNDPMLGAFEVLQQWREYGDRYYRAAAKIHHPDTGGDAETFRRLTEARDVLQGAHA